MEDFTIGQRIAAKRKELGLSQIALGEQMGVSRQSISKWEADAAIPEIDKLIALSKLFGVSVGWLLGVEEGPEPAQEAEREFTDREWEIIDRLTQAEPKLPKWLIPLTAVTAAAALIAVLLAGAAFWNARSSREALAAVSQSIAMMTAGLPEVPEDTAVLGSSQFLLEPSGDLQQCTLHFTADPAVYVEGAAGELLVFADGQEVSRTACDWNGFTYTCSVTLDVRNGYTTVFTVTTPDGIVRSAKPFDHTVYTLGNAAAFGTVMVEFMDHEFRDGVLTLTDMHFNIDLPDLLRDTGDLWEKCDLVVTAQGQELGRLDILNRSKYSKQINFSEDPVDFLTQSQSIEIGDLSGFHQLELLLDCGFTNGMQMHKSIKIWTVNDGRI